MMGFFILACVAMMIFVMRRQSPPTTGASSAPMNIMSQWGMGFGPWKGIGAPNATATPNAAFEQYRQQTLEQLEREQTDFKSFLDQLRLAKDKAEFDQFIAERRPTAV
jgi:hypothetical protein